MCTAVLHSCYMYQGRIQELEKGEVAREESVQTAKAEKMLAN